MTAEMHIWKKYNRVLNEYKATKCEKLRAQAIFLLGMVHTMRQMGVLFINEDFILDDARLLNVDLL